MEAGATTRQHHGIEQPDAETSHLSPSQEFRVRVARNDLTRVHGRDLSAAPASELTLEIGALVSSLLNVLQIVEDLAVGEEP